MLLSLHNKVGFSRQALEIRAMCLLLLWIPGQEVRFTYMLDWQPPGWGVYRRSCWFESSESSGYCKGFWYWCLFTSFFKQQQSYNVRLSSSSLLYNQECSCAMLHEIWNPHDGKDTLVCRGLACTFGFDLWTHALVLPLFAVQRLLWVCWFSGWCYITRSSIDSVYDSISILWLCHIKNSSSSSSPGHSPHHTHPTAASLAPQPISHPI